MTINHFTDLTNYIERNVPLDDIIDQVFRKIITLIRSRSMCNNSLLMLSPVQWWDWWMWKGCERRSPAASRIATPPEQKRTADIRFRWATEEAIKLIKEKNNTIILQYLKRIIVRRLMNCSTIHRGYNEQSNVTTHRGHNEQSDVNTHRRQYE